MQREERTAPDAANGLAWVPGPVADRDALVHPRARQLVPNRMCVTPGSSRSATHLKVAASGWAVDATVPGARDIAHRLVRCAPSDQPALAIADEACERVGSRCSVASELVGNAAAHARTACRLTMRLDARGLTIAVRDFDHLGLLNALACTSIGRSDHGLFLVASISRAWGVARPRRQEPSGRSCPSRPCPS